MPSASPCRVAAARKQIQRLHQEDGRRTEERDAHADLDLPPRPMDDNADAEPGAGTGSDDHQHQRCRIDRHQLGVDERLGDRRERVADVQRAWHQLHRHHRPQLVGARRRRERPDAERIEEGGYEADDRLERRRRDEPTAYDDDQIEDEKEPEADEEELFSVQ